MRLANLLAVVPLATLVECTLVTTPATQPTPDADVPVADAASPPTADAAPGVDASAPDAPIATGCDAPIAPPPAALGLSPFYKKHLDATGLPVVASDKVSDGALRQACRIASKMLSFRSDVRAAMTSKKARLAVMARSEVTTDVPEHADLYQAFPGTDWNVRARGLGGTVARPATSCAEENLLCDTKGPVRRREHPRARALARHREPRRHLRRHDVPRPPRHGLQERDRRRKNGRTPTRARTSRSTSPRACSRTSTRTSRRARRTESTTT
ncbi:MAG: hypothetical protein IPK71_11680 [Myxococcales bacterium]|nr:hypothetical protein [Myxococcales bacterium]